MILEDNKLKQFYSKDDNTSGCPHCVKIVKGQPRHTINANDCDNCYGKTLLFNWFDNGYGWEYLPLRCWLPYPINFRSEYKKSYRYFSQRDELKLIFSISQDSKPVLDPAWIFTIHCNCLQLDTTSIKEFDPDKYKSINDFAEFATSKAEQLINEKLNQITQFTSATFANLRGAKDE